MLADSPDDSMMRQTALGRAIKREREKQSLSQRDLAEQARLHVTSLNKIESGANNLSLETISRIAHALSLKTSELLAKAHQ